MENKLLNGLKAETNMKTTENCAAAYKSTLNAVLDLFALGGSYRTRSESDIISLFQKAFNADPTYALRALFYLRDIRGGAGERRFFRVCYNWLAKNYPDIAKRNLLLIPEYGRWDDLFCVFNTQIEEEVLKIIKNQLNLDCLAILSEETNETVYF